MVPKIQASTLPRKKGTVPAKSIQTENGACRIVTHSIQSKTTKYKDRVEETKTKYSYNEKKIAQSPSAVFFNSMYLIKTICSKVY